MRRFPGGWGSVRPRQERSEVLSMACRQPAEGPPGSGAALTHHYQRPTLLPLEFLTEKCCPGLPQGWQRRPGGHGPAPLQLGQETLSLGCRRGSERLGPLCLCGREHGSFEPRPRGEGPGWEHPCGWRLSGRHGATERPGQDTQACTWGHHGVAVGPSGGGVRGQAGLCSWGGRAESQDQVSHFRPRRAGQALPLRGLSSPSGPSLPTLSPRMLPPQNPERGAAAPWPSRGKAVCPS